MLENKLSITQIAFMNDVPVEEVNCRMCSFCNLATINFDRKTCMCIHWDERVKLHSFCTHYTRQYDKVG